MARMLGRSRATTLKEVVAGISLAFRGVRAWGTDPRLLAIGVVPGLITMTLFGAGVVVLIWRLTAMSRWVAEQIVADDGAAQAIVQIIVGLAIVAAAALLTVYTFTAVTLLIGQPFFERISARVDQNIAIARDVRPWWRIVLADAGDAARLILVTIPAAIVLVLVGAVPGIGTAIALVLSAVVGGWFLALELTSGPLAARGITSLSQRRAVLRSRRVRVHAFGAVVFLAFLLPLGAAVLMPAAVVGATLLVQSLPTPVGAPTLEESEHR